MAKTDKNETTTDETGAAAAATETDNAVTAPPNAAAANVPAPLETHDAETGEIVPVGEGAVATVGGVAFKIKKTVALPMLSLNGLTQFAITVTKPAFEGKEVKVTRRSANGTGGEGGSFTSKAVMIECVDLTDNVTKNMVLGTVMKGYFEEYYPDNAYVGKSFIGQKLDSQGRNYAKWSLYEIERA